MSSATFHAARGGRPKACCALIAVRAIFSKLSERLAVPVGAPLPAQSFCVVACAVRRELIALLHADTRLLVLSAGALVVVACMRAGPAAGMTRRGHWASAGRRGRPDEASPRAGGRAR
jgi:hypothetical protein